MLNIYYGRESVDKEKFIYEEIARRGFDASSPVIVLVPDQYTLEAERQAFRHIRKEAMIGLDIYSISRLGHNILSKTGQGDLTFIDKYGRQMLLTRVMKDIKEDLSVYRGSATKPSFIEKMNDFISEMKQYGTDPDELLSILDNVHGSEALRMKLLDMQKIYSAYSERIAGKYTDSEDYVDLVADAVRESGILSGTRIYVYGFDSFAPRSLSVIGALMKSCPEVNVVLTCSNEDDAGALFELTAKVKDNLIGLAGEEGVKTGEIKELDGPLVTGQADTISHIEKELFSGMPGKYPEEAQGEYPGVTIVEAANPHNEAESAATHILHLVRDKGLRFRDIVVIANDQEKMAPMMERVFSEYGLSVFRDSKRDISGSGIAVYMVSMLMACVRRMRTEEIFRTLKTGISELTQDEVEKLENYSVRYRITGSMWEKPFVRGRCDYSEEELAEIEDIRKRAVGPFLKLSGIIKESGTFGEFIKRFYLFLTEDMDIQGELTDLMEAQKEAGLEDLSEETKQVFRMIAGILEQIDDLMGEEPFDARTFLDLFSMGLTQVEVGVLPMSPDDIMIGTMQRTRAGKVKSVVIVGANDGIIPQGRGSAGLFQDDELEELTAGGREVCKVDRVRRQEERLAMYRNFSKASDELWISYSVSDDRGGSMRPSEVIEDLKEMFPGIKVKRDVLNSGDDKELVGGELSTLRHLAEKATEGGRRKIKDPVWQAVLDFYSGKSGIAENVLGTLDFDNREKPLSEETRDVLLSEKNGGDSLSPSRLEQYARCPFAYFVEYGLAPEELRVFEAGSREIGDVYHHALMEITGKLTREGRWEDITQAELGEIISKTAEEERKNYRDGLFDYTNDEKYRLTRIEKTLKESMDLLLSHARRSKTKESFYEESFGRGRKLAPVEVDTKNGKVYIEGTIDRMDVLENGRVKITDYKSGKQVLDKTLIKAGYKLQLMLYMKAAEESRRKPAGVFYFYIGTDDVDARALGADITGLNEETASADAKKKLRERIEVQHAKNARMDGFVVNDPETLSQIIGGSDEPDGMSPIKVDPDKKNGGYKTSASDYLLSDEEFQEVQDEAMDTVKKLASGIRDGRIDIHPMKPKKGTSACQYCDFKGICRFDQGFSGCRYNVVK